MFFFYYEFGIVFVFCFVDLELISEVFVEMLFKYGKV